MEQLKKIPIILDTDIGTDIDDLWALIMLLNSPELDVKLITTATGDCVARAKIVAKVLALANRTDIPIAIGKSEDGWEPVHHGDWAKDLDFANYAGTVTYNAAEEIVKVIMNSDEMITLITIGPLSNIGAALDLEPKIAENAKVIAMLGDVYRMVDGVNKAIAETNSRLDVPACKKVIAAKWEKTIAPLDTCGTIVLEGERYSKIFNSTNKLCVALMKNNELFAKNNSWLDNYPWKERSSVLFDTQAIWLAFSSDYLSCEKLKLTILDNGTTSVDNEAGYEVNCALEWLDYNSYLDCLVERLLVEDIGVK